MHWNVFCIVYVFLIFLIVYCCCVTFTLRLKPDPTVWPPLIHQPLGLDGMWSVSQRPTPAPFPHSGSFAPLTHPSWRKSRLWRGLRKRLYLSWKQGPEPAICSHCLHVARGMCVTWDSLFRLVVTLPFRLAWWCGLRIWSEQQQLVRLRVWVFTAVADVTVNGSPTCSWHKVCIYPREGWIHFFSQTNKWSIYFSNDIISHLTSGCVHTGLKRGPVSYAVRLDLFMSLWKDWMT